MASDFEANANLILPNLWLGSENAGSSPPDELQAKGITHILVPARLHYNAVHYPHLFHYMVYNIADMSAFPLLPLLPQLVEFIEKAIEEGGTVLVHCAAGASRSASVVIAFIMKKNCWSAAQSISFVRSKRSCVSSKFEQQLQLWHEMGYSLDGQEPVHDQVRKNYRPSPFTKEPLISIPPNQKENGETK